MISFGIGIYLSQKYDVIILEDLNVEGMKKIGKGLLKSVSLDFSGQNS